MNEKLKNVKLGAPESIAVNNCGTLGNLKVQITERLESISFKGNTGTKNPFERAADLLRQQEEEANKESDLDVELSIPTDAILNGGDTICTINSGEPRDYYWQLQNIQGNFTNPPTIDQRGNIKMEEGKWAEFDIKVKRYADASWKKRHIVYNLLQKRPELSPLVAEWPDVINNIVDTGKINWLVTNGDAYINTGFIPTSDSTVITDMYLTQASGALFGAATTSVYGYAVYYSGSGSSVWHDHNSDNGAGSCVFGNVHIEKRKNVLWMNNMIKQTAAEKEFICTKPLYIFAMSNPNGTPARIPSDSSNFKIANFEAYDNEIKARELVPFVRNGQHGLIDLLTGVFYSNANTTGSFTIITEDK